MIDVEASIVCRLVALAKATFHSSDAWVFSFPTSIT